MKIVLDHDTGRSRGCAFVTFADPSDAVSAADRVDGRDIDGRRVRCNLAHERGDRHADRDRRPRPRHDVRERRPRDEHDRRDRRSPPRGTSRRTSPGDSHARVRSRRTRSTRRRLAKPRTQTRARTQTPSKQKQKPRTPPPSRRRRRRRCPRRRRRRERVTFDAREARGARGGFGAR